MLIEFCLPIYNEEKILKNNILKLLNFCEEKKFSFTWKIILIINGSSDKSLEISKNLKVSNPEKIDFVNYIEGGKGNAIKKYFDSSQADVLSYMDVDLAVSLDDLENLINPIIKKEAQIVMGSRLLPDSITDRNFLRELSSQTYNLISKIILGHNFSDLQCGFKAMEKSTFQKISPYIQNKNWFFDTEIITYARKFNFKIKEIPVDWSENRYEDRKSKIKIFKDGFKFLCNLIKLKLKIINFK